MSARIAVEEAAPPASVATWLPKKYLSSKVPRGVAMNFCVVTREMCLLVQAERRGDLAQHERPHRHLAVLEEVALAVDDRLRHAQDVSKRCCTFLISQRASCNCEQMPAPLRAAAARHRGG